MGSIDLVAPKYEGKDSVGTAVGGVVGGIVGGILGGVAGREIGGALGSGKAKAWIQAGTGTCQVTRSYMGAPAGANGTYYLTAAASTRVDTHEVMHVNQTKAQHDAFITPLEARILKYTGEANALEVGTTKAEAVAALQAVVLWNASISLFQNGDTVQNTPGGLVDAGDLASGTYMQDKGPATVGGVAYLHYIALPSEAVPAAAGGAGGAGGAAGGAGGAGGAAGGAGGAGGGGGAGGAGGAGGGGAGGGGTGP